MEHGRELGRSPTLLVAAAYRYIPSNSKKRVWPKNDNFRPKPDQLPTPTVQQTRKIHFVALTGTGKAMKRMSSVSGMNVVKASQSVKLGERGFEDKAECINGENL